MPNEYKNYYQILGVSRNATQAQIEQRYRDLCKELDPDYPEDAEMIAALELFKNAYSTLIDYNLRSAYDEATLIELTPEQSRGLAQLFRSGNFAAIDEIWNNAADYELEQRTYIAWRVASRRRAPGLLSEVYTTTFINDDANFPVASLEYEEHSLNTDHPISIRIVFRTNLANTKLREKLTMRAFTVNNPDSADQSIPLTDSICFPRLHDDLQDYEFICDEMRPAKVLNGKQCQFGTVYFASEASRTKSIFTERDQTFDPGAAIQNWAYGLYQRAHKAITGTEIQSTVSEPDPNFINELNSTPTPTYRS